jgi:DNA replication protein DnaC
VATLGNSHHQNAKILSQFDFAATPGMNHSFNLDLAICAFIQRHENMLFCGPTGVGKTHLANALGVEALKRGPRVISKPTFRLVVELTASRANGSYNRHMTSILKRDLLIMDDFGLQVLPPAAIQDLYEIIFERYERGSILVTPTAPSNSGRRFSTTTCCPRLPLTARPIMPIFWSFKVKVSGKSPEEKRRY